MSETDTTLPVEGGVATPAPAEQQPVATVPAEGQGQNPPTEPEPQAPEPTPEEREKARADRAFARLRAERWEARQEAAELRGRLQEIERQQQQARDPNAPLTPADIDRIADQRAEQKMQQAQFTARCNEAYATGAKEIPGFEESVQQLRMAGGNALPVIVQAALETEVPHKVIDYLGRNPEEAEALARMSPVALGAAVAKLAAKAAAPPPPKPVSAAPAPIKPLATSSTVSDAEPKDVEEWMKWRRRQVAR